MILSNEINEHPDLKNLIDNQQTSRPNSNSSNCSAQSEVCSLLNNISFNYNIESGGSKNIPYNDKKMVKALNDNFGTTDMSTTNSEDKLIEQEGKKTDVPTNKIIGRKRGRKKKIDKKENPEPSDHNKYSPNNAVRRILNSCNKSIYIFINSKLPKNKKINKPTIKKLLGNSKKDYKKFFGIKCYEIIYKTIPKRYKGQKIKVKKIKLSEEEENNIYEMNKIKIKEILENNNSKELYDLIFNLTFGDFLKAYLNDENNITINETTINLKGFKTYNQCLNDEYTNEKNQKPLYREILLNILNNQNK